MHCKICMKKKLKKEKKMNKKFEFSKNLLLMSLEPWYGYSRCLWCNNCCVCGSKDVCFGNAQYY